MCGIVGYVGTQPVVPIILEGLRRLEYRGYDSAGIAIAGIASEPGTLEVRRAPGKLVNLEAVLQKDPLLGTYGIGHTRWATHGRPTEENAHPHRDGTGTLVVVHNGIVENYLALKQELIARGHIFKSETDTEIIAHLIEDELNNRAPSVHPNDETQNANESEAVIKEQASSPIRIGLEQAVRQAVKRLTGAFAIGVLSARDPNKLIAARNGPPAVIGIGDNEYFLASDVPGILHHTRNIIFLQDGDLAILTPTGVQFTDFDGNPLERKPQRITWDPIQAEKGGYKHFMLKEINEQPRAIRDTTLGRVSFDTGEVFLPDLHLSREQLKSAADLTISACGTSWHAALAGKYMIERLARLPVDVDYASEYRYRDPIPSALGLLITQSGETADTIAAQAEMISKGTPTLAICNVVGSAITRKAQGVITTNAGPEIGVASTKAFTAQLTALFTLAMYLGQQRGTLTPELSLHYATELAKIPAKAEEILRTLDGTLNNAPGNLGAPNPASRVIPNEERNLLHPSHEVRSGNRSGLQPPEGTNKTAPSKIQEIAKLFSNAHDFLFLGRGIHYPIALEGALKLKEISYIHAEGYPAGEMKHGPNALIDENLPVVCIATQDPNDPGSVQRYEKTLSNIQEVTARSGRVIAIATEGDNQITGLVEQTLHIPTAPDLLIPILETIPLQLLAYHIAVRRGCDVDQPRNLAKSVTVE